MGTNESSDLKKTPNALEVHLFETVAMETDQ